VVTDLPLYLAIGVPTFAVLIGILMNAVQLNTTNTRISNLEMRVDARFNNLDVKFDTLTSKVVDIDNRVTRIEGKLGIV
jgi:hypothetical protein